MPAAAWEFSEAGPRAAFRTFDPTGPGSRRCLRTACLLPTGKLEGTYYRQAPATKQDIFGDGHPDVAVTLNNLGAIPLAQHRDAQARELFEHALEIFEHSLIPGRPAVAICREKRDSCR